MATFWMFFYIPFNLRRLLEKDDSNNELVGVLVVLSISIVFGGLLFKGKSKLTETYIAMNNKSYQNHINISLIITSVLFGLIISIFYYQGIYQFIVYFLISTITTLFIISSINNQFSYKRISLLLAPFFMIWHEDFMISERLSLILITLDYFIMVIIILRYNRKLSTLKFRFVADDLIDNAEKNSCYLGSKIGSIIVNLKSFRQGKIDFSIKSPFVITGLIGVMGFSLLLVYSFLAKISLSDLLILPNILIALFVLMISVNSSKLMSGTTKFAHVYTGGNHKQFKNKLLASFDKSILLNSLIFLSLLFFVLTIDSIPFDYRYLLVSSAAVFIFSISFYPIIICCCRKKIVRLIPLVIYTLINFFIIYQIFAKGINNISKVELLSFIVLCIVFRVFAQMLLWNTSYEKLVNADEW